MPEGLNIIAGGAAVMALFAAWVWLFGLLNDKLKSRAESIEAGNVGQQKQKAERLVRLIGVVTINLIHAFAWLSGLLILPGFLIIVYQGAWLFVPIVFVLSLVPFLILNWTERTLQALGREQ